MQRDLPPMELPRQVGELLAFLEHAACETRCLVGDIIDGWQLRRQWYWPQAHNDVVQKLLRKACEGTRVVFVPGNHDEFARKYVQHNRHLNSLRPRMVLPYWSRSKWLKPKVKRAVSYVGDFEVALARKARKRACQKCAEATSVQLAPAL